ncbi:organic hydroperoxide resistance protein [Mesorhizobium sp.]|uniref:organic hydroperoxide resistance protein n=2 Tax=Mesorhizobium sp. TaxID=1871066 RepID=UPI000FE49934|nr:organic hydroperoxide resistance protein [Mesorhizobium sp.]RWC32367.1 MAG: organic hydroperoxide resistance protein [Mesorhizobium sp.]RWC42097.1 MAG: organic hydroperoxide resistance protein [Mesorhizobium sp.]RWC55920.1 MAG: organic hydroperoxide resistance protein [Mesorhizobium sp.]RWC64739.1 MAG: organic hydroperoxide resistance protein [Mesorhizobium sp.]TIW91353.1 MAG: organic hydroperoxide resistance protein [Mesorhizobium sp.]
MPALYSTQARAVGGRAGHVQSDDGLLSLDLAMPKALGGKGGATNPEQLFAAGYAACFESAMRFIAGKQKLPLQDASVTANVSLHSNAQGGFVLGVSLAAETKGLDQAAAEALVSAAHQVCPYSNAIKGNIEVALSAKALPAKAA